MSRSPEAHSPGEHVRDARSMLMLKLLFHARRRSRAGALLRAQHERFASTVAALGLDFASSRGYARTLARWRLESATAALRFVDGLATESGYGEGRPANERTEMKISARNQLPGRVTGITQGEALANVEVDVSGQRVVASITVEAVRDLGLAEGSEVTVLVKASDVILATGD